MSIEDDMFNAFKHVNFGYGNINPLKMVEPILRNLEKLMLERMLAQIKVRLGELKGEDQSMDPFGILGVDQHSTKEEVTRAYRKKAAEVHPDKNLGDPDANIEMAKVNAAYDAIFLYKGWRK